MVLKIPLNPPNFQEVLTPETKILHLLLNPVIQQLDTNPASIKPFYNLYKGLRNSKAVVLDLVKQHSEVINLSPQQPCYWSLPHNDTTTTVCIRIALPLTLNPATKTQSKPNEL